jgi:hypothetical protein
VSAAPFAVNNREDLTRAITVMEQAGALGTAHLLRALRDGRVAVLPLAPDEGAGKFKAWARITAGRPAVALIGDDDGLDRGPAGWRQAARAMAWARGVMLHAAGAETRHYEAAIVAARLTGRVLIVECGTATLPAWIALAKAAPSRPGTLIIRPREGAHPAPIEGRSMH